MCGRSVLNEKHFHVLPGPRVSNCRIGVHERCLWQFFDVSCAQKVEEAANGKTTHRKLILFLCALSENTQQRHALCLKAKLTHMRLKSNGGSSFLMYRIYTMRAKHCSHLWPLLYVSTCTLLTSKSPNLLTVLSDQHQCSALSELHVE